MRALMTIALISLLTNLSNAQDKLTQKFYFASDSFNIKSKHQTGLDRIRRNLRANPYYRIRIDGNTDSVGDRGYNLELSKKRIKSIRDKFIAMGLNPKRIKTQPKGEDWPVFSNATDRGKSKNRRVDVYILLDKDSCFKDGCAQTCIPKGTFDPYFTNEMAINFIPITNVEQMQTNNLSAQTVDGGYLFSSGMLRVTSTYKGIPVSPKKKVTIRIPAYKLDESFTIWEGARSRNRDVNWKEKKMDVKRGNDGCAYFEIDGSLLNKWVNIDKPRPAGNMICLDNPFSYLDMPAIDSDTSKVIEDDIVLSFPKDAFSSKDFVNLEVESERINTLCEVLALRMTSKTTNDQFLGRNQDILQLAGFKVNGAEVSPNMSGFRAYFPATERNIERDFYVAEKGQKDELLWAYVGKADSIYTIDGCDCKYLVKNFSYPTSFINLTSEAEENELLDSQVLFIRKHIIDELVIYDRREKRLTIVEPNSDGRFVIPVRKNYEKLVVVGQYSEDGDDFVFDGRLGRFRKRWFKKERIVKKKAFRKVNPKKGLRLKSISCRTPI
jgi:OmpA family